MIVTTLGVADPGVEVRSTTDCPSAQEVSTRLVPLLPPFTDPTAARDLARIQVLEIHHDGTTRLWLRLSRPDGSDIGTRRVSLPGSCVEMAETVATLFAAWKIDPQTGGSADQESPPEESPPVVESHAPPAALPRPATPLDYLLGASTGAALVGGIAATGSLELRVGRPTSPWQVRLGVAGQTVRRSDLAPPGQVEWQHTHAALGLALRLPHPRWLLSLDAGPLAGWVTLA
jgi:hypothetical protein